MANLHPGDKAPDFELKDQNKHMMKLSDYRDRKLLVYFYPKADTPGCTTQATSIRDTMGELIKARLSVIGISPDSPEEQKEFDDKYCFGFPLLSDSDHEVAEAYGVWDAKDRKIIRSAFIIGEEGKIIDAFYQIKPEDTVPKVLEALGTTAT